MKFLEESRHKNSNRDIMSELDICPWVGSFFPEGWFKRGEWHVDVFLPSRSPDDWSWWGRRRASQLRRASPPRPVSTVNGCLPACTSSRRSARLAAQPASPTRHSSRSPRLQTPSRYENNNPTQWAGLSLAPIDFAIHEFAPHAKFNLETRSIWTRPIPRTFVLIGTFLIL